MAAVVRGADRAGEPGHHPAARRAPGARVPRVGAPGRGQHARRGPRGAPGAGPGERRAPRGRPDVGDAAGVGDVRRPGVRQRRWAAPIVRGYADLEERKRYADAFPDLRPEERALALEERRRHKTAVVLLHEIGHTFGA